MKSKEHYAHLLDEGDWASDKSLHRDAKRAVRQRAMEKAYVDDLRRRETAAFYKRHQWKIVALLVLLSAPILIPLSAAAIDRATRSEESRALGEILRQTEAGTLSLERSVSILGAEPDSEVVLNESDQIEQLGRIYAPYLFTRYWDQSDGSIVAVRFVDGGVALKAWRIKPAPRR